MSAPLINEDFTKASENKNKAFVLDQQMQAKSVAMGNLAPDQISGIIANALAIIQKQRSNENEKREQRTRDMLQLALLSYMDNLRSDIANLEATFHAEFGDAWREELALRILGEDDIPQQQNGETIEQYRERLEQALIQEMLNDDGTIKHHYANNPDLAKYAEWAQKNYNLDTAQDRANDLASRSIDHPQTKLMLDELDKKANVEITLATADKLENHQEHQNAVLNIDDNNRDINGLEIQADTALAFLKPN